VVLDSSVKDLFELRNAVVWTFARIKQPPLHERDTVKLSALGNVVLQHGSLDVFWYQQYLPQDLVHQVVLRFGGLPCNFTDEFVPVMAEHIDFGKPGR
jgi:hypothetical protein